MARRRVNRIPSPKRIFAALQQAQESTVSAASTSTGGVLKFVGAAEPGPRGPLTAPMSSQPCVWYRSVMTPSTGTWMNRMRPTPGAPSDVPAPANTALGGQPIEQLSPEPFGVSDGRAVVAVNAGDADIDSTVFAVNERRPRSPGYPPGLWQEWIIPVGAPVFALGRVERGEGGTWLVPTDNGTLLVSTRPEQQVLIRQQFGLQMRPRLSLLAGIGAAAALVVVILVVLVALH